MKLVETFEEARDLSQGATGLVPTMGYFHEGHISLMDEARRRDDTVVVSLFVNPLQFGLDEDLDDYPRNLDRDATLADQAGVDLLVVPAAEEMFPEPPETVVSVDALARPLDGRYRPVHFDGVATVVAKLFAGLQPDRAYFGRKDAQQLAIVRRLAADLSFPVEIVGMPIVRESDGLALSSRNLYLDRDERAAAASLSRGLGRAAAAVAEGERAGAALEEAAMAEMAADPLVRPEYAELHDAVGVFRLPALDREAFLAVSAHVGKARLIDNVRFVPEDGTYAADLGVRLDGPSILERGS